MLTFKRYNPSNPSTQEAGGSLIPEFKASRVERWGGGWGEEQTDTVFCVSLLAY